MTDKLKIAYFMLIAVMMYYFLTEIINLGIFVTFRHVLALVLFGSAFVTFLYRPNIARGMTAVKGAVCYSAPLLVTILASLFIWFSEQVSTDVIARGLSGAFIYTNMLSFALAAAAMLYIFGEKGIWYNLAAILIANIMIIGTIILEHGMSGYFSELFALITTFAAETGDIIVQAEVHELAFCLGAYLIYMLLKPQKNPVYAILLTMTMFCFLSAFKRIGIIAIVLALVLGWGMKWFAKISPKAAFRTVTILSVAIVVVLVGYIGLIKIDIFSMLEEFGIETRGRVEIYRAVD